MDRPPFDVGERSLFVAYFSSAEWNCFLSLGWPLPVRVLDLWCEFRNLLNGSKPPAGWGLLSCLAFHGLDSMDASEKTEMRELAIRGGPFTSEEMAALMDYCQTDVDALDKLLPMMLPKIDFPRAIHRGRYMVAVSAMEHAGVPIDVETLAMFRRQWVPIKTKLIESVDESFGVFDGTTFKQDRFADYLIRHGIPWPETDTGRLALDDDTFRQQAKSYPQVSPLRELRHALSEMKLGKLGSRIGRTEPNDVASVRQPIRPEPTVQQQVYLWSVRVVAFVDQADTRDVPLPTSIGRNKNLALRPRCPVIRQWPKRMRPATRTWNSPRWPVRSQHRPPRQSHPAERSAFKVCMLATQYGMSEHGLAAKLNKPVAFARNLLRQHRETFPVFWRWSQSQVDAAMLLGRLQTVFGWTIHTIGGDNPRSLANFPMQANGAEMMRLACSLATEAGITVCCPVHDAILIEAPTDAKSTPRWPRRKRSCKRPPGSFWTASSWNRTPRSCLGRNATTMRTEAGKCGTRCSGWPPRRTDETERNCPKRGTECPKSGTECPTRTLLLIDSLI